MGVKNKFIFVYLFGQIGVWLSLLRWNVAHWLFFFFSSSFFFFFFCQHLCTVTRPAVFPADASKYMKGAAWIRNHVLQLLRDLPVPLKMVPFTLIEFRHEEKKQCLFNCSSFRESIVIISEFIIKGLNCTEFNSIQFICIAHYHKLQMCLRVLYNLYT